MNIEDIYTLENRGIIYISGSDTKKFLQNIVSNNIEKINDKTTIFSSLLTPQGKYLFDFIITKHKNGFFLDCQKSQAKELFKKLILYKLRSKVEILNLSNEFVVAVLSQDKFLNLNKNNFATYLFIGIFLVFVSIFDVFLNSFLKINLLSSFPNLISSFFPLLIGFIGLYLIRVEYSGLKYLDLLNKNINTNNFNAVLTLLIIFTIIFVIIFAISYYSKK